MNNNILSNVSKKLVPKNYLEVAFEANRVKSKIFNELLEKRKLPDDGFQDTWIEELLRYCSSLDSNNFAKKCGMGEREARIVCSLVAQRHYSFGHGIGRSGDLLEAQPKAAGSTLINSLTNDLLVSLFQALGFNKDIKCFLVPMATGMTITLCLLSLRKVRPKSKYVIWSRIDQKACFKAISTAGFIPVVIDTLLTEKGLATNLEEFEKQILELEAEDILAIYSTTSCFAPRQPDDIVKLAELAKKYEIPHLVNNAYGLQDSDLIKTLNRASTKGRIDVFVQSTDKNLLVPVGGAIVSSFQKDILENISRTYSGRASISQTLDVLMTLLSLGKLGFLSLIKKREEHFVYLRDELAEVAKKYNQKVLNSSGNNISLAMTLNFESCEDYKIDFQLLGSMLFRRGVSGTRVITCDGIKTIDNFNFIHWGSHSSDSKGPYLTAAVALGCERPEIDTFIRKLKDCLAEFVKPLKVK